MLHIDDSELADLELDISFAPGRVQRNANKVLRRAGTVLDAEMTKDATGHQGNLWGRPGTSYDTPLEKHVSHELLDFWTLEVGIEYKGAGKLAHIIAKGSVKNAPAYDYLAALRRTQPAIIRMFADAAEESVLGDD